MCEAIERIGCLGDALRHGLELVDRRVHLGLERREPAREEPVAIGGRDAVRSVHGSTMN